MPRCSHLTPLFLASLSLSPPVSPADPVCSLVNLEGGDAQEAPREGAPGGRHVALGSEGPGQRLTFLSASTSEREGERAASPRSHRRTCQPALPGSNTKGSRPSPDGRVTLLSLS